MANTVCTSLKAIDSLPAHTEISDRTHSTADQTANDVNIHFSRSPSKASRATTASAPTNSEPPMRTQFEMSCSDSVKSRIRPPHESRVQTAMATASTVRETMIGDGREAGT